ncbi:hypothetical protein EDD21DRAFT_445241 [Dissophora ornata]|nr:hypothetical protein EDD21DRAFT_445241 [Dissophora ornata]
MPNDHPRRHPCLPVYDDHHGLTNIVNMTKDSKRAYNRHFCYSSQARIYGVALSLYVWSLWCCDHYLLGLPFSGTVIIVGAVLIWRSFPSSSTAMLTTDQTRHGGTLQKSTSALATTESIIGGSQVTIAAKNGVGRGRVAVEIPVSAISAATQQADSAVILALVQCDTKTQAQEYETDDMGVMPLAIDDNDGEDGRHGHRSQHFVPLDPPPPYHSRKNSVAASTVTECLRHSDMQPNSHRQRCAESGPCVYPHLQQRHRYIWLNLIVCLLSVCGWWMCCAVGESGTWTRIESSSLSLLPLLYEYKNEHQELVAAGVIGFLNLAGVCALISRFSETACTADTDSDEAVIETDSNADRQTEALLSSAVIELAVPDERQAEEQKSQAKEHVKAIRRWSTYASSSLTTTATLPPSISISIRQVQRELRIWTLSCFALAPVIPRCRWGNSSTSPPPLSSRAGPLSNRSQDDCEYEVIRHDEAELHAKEILQAATTAAKLVLRGSESVSALVARSRISDAAISRLARTALDPERLGSIIQFYRRRHVAAAASAETHMVDPNQERKLERAAAEDKEELAFVVRSSRLPTARVGLLYGTAQKRLWTSTGSIDLEHIDNVHGEGLAGRPRDVMREWVKGE